MKMKDTFNLPLKSEQGGVMPYLKDDMGAVIFVGDDDNVNATVTAINNHDELVSALTLIMSDEKFLSQHFFNCGYHKKIDTLLESIKVKSND